MRSTAGLGRGTATAVIALSTVVALAGCAPAAPVDPGAPAATSAPTGISSPAAAPQPTLVPEGTASENLEYFRSVLRPLRSKPDTGGRAAVTLLVKAGFDKSAMEVTADITSVGVKADNIIVSVRFGADCLLGQWGNTRFRSAIAPVLDSGRCLVGKTRPIDW